MDNTYTSRLINIAGLVKTKVKSLVAFFVLFLLLGTSTYAQQNRTVSPAGNKGSISINAGQDGKGLLTKVDSYDNGIDDMLKKYDKQIYFTQNKGQWPSHIRYKADFKFGQAIVTDKGMMVGAFDPTSLLASYAQSNRAEKAQHDGLPFNEAPVKIKGHGWVMNFAGASPSMRITNKNEHPDKFNYFYGNGFSGTDVSSYDEIWYNNVYNNIDVRYYPSAEGTLEYDVIVKPGANPSAIAINFDGIDKLELTREGHLVLNTSVGAMDLPEPYAYQMINGKEVKVDAAYALNDKNQLTFTLGKYDTSKPLIIDPIALRWATWVNSNSTGDNHGHGIWVDPSGNIYMVARVDGSTNLITNPGAFDVNSNGGIDIIVGKYTEPATVGGAGVRVWQTYIGGSGSDNPYVTEMGPDGNLYMAGQTGSTDFPVTGGTGFTGTPINHQSQTGDDIFVLKINPSGTGIKSAVIGGNGTDNAFDLRIATNGDVIVGGFTTSTNLLTQYAGSGATNSNAGGNDAFLFRINQNLDAVSWVRNFGGSGADQINILVNNPTTGDIFVAGNTASSSGITTGTPRQGTLVGSSTGFLRRYNSTGAAQWGSYFNSASGGTTSILCMEFNSTRDRLYFAGITTGLGTNNTPSGTYDGSVSGTNDFYIAHMNIDQTFYASTYIGSSGAENNLMGLNVDDNNDVYIFGYVGNDGYPTAGNPLQSTRSGSTDKVFSKINSVLTTLQYSTYYGGTSQEEDPVGQRGIKFANCRIYTIVTARSTDVPLTNGAVTTTKLSSTSIYEPGIVEWANPPDLINNSISASQNICSGSTPTGLDGQTPSYVLPTLIRNGTTSAHPSVGAISSYQWQRSPDNTTWTNIVGATGEDITGAQIGALTQTTYFRRIINGDYCTVSAQTNIQVTVFTISGTQTNNTCYGTSSGAINITPSGAPGTVTYAWSDGATTEDRTGLAAGTYSVTATSGGCTATATFTITQGTEITGTITTTNASCQAVCNGTATVSGVTGGTGPYTYTWLSGGTGATKTGLCAGTNYVVITDAAGCKDTMDFSINTNPPTQISITVNNVYCVGDNSGTATVNILSGTGPYTYLWSNGQTTQTATGLTVGTYTVTVTDANGCSVSSNAIVQEYSNLVALVSTTEANGGNNGTASVSVFGGTSPYTYLWSNGATTPSISGLATGNYSVTVTDAAGNTVTQIFSITTINDIAAGSFIINMGITPQTFANGLKPYGLIYDLTRNQNVPVKWVIKTSKAKDAADFTINGTDFKSGAFVIEAKYRTPAVNAVISNWVAQGVIGITTTAAVTLPVYKTITTFSNVVVDQQNENLVLPYFANAGLPTSMYTVGLPSSLDGCDDAYVMPHADPTWATHSNLLTFNTTNKGYIWGGCHAPSVLEGIFNPSNSSQRMNFLSSTGLQCFNGNGCGSLITESHGNPTLPYTYQASYNSDPIMQFMGDLTPSTENGSERWYIPLTTGQWRPTSSPAITTADGASPRQGVKLVYGPGFGNTNNGMVMYEAGHTSDGKGTVANQVAFQRAFFNFLLNAGIQKGLSITANIPQTFVSGVGQTASVTVTGGSAPYTYAWSTACGATIANPTAASTSITFPSLAPQTQCFVTCVVTDACGRRNFVSVAIASQTMPPAPFTITLTGQTNNTCFGACTGAINITPSGATPPYTYTWSNGATTQDLTGLCNGTYTVTVRDANNCTKTATYIITSPTAISATIGSQTNVLCFGQSTGSVTVNATGGTSPFTYKIGSGSYGSSNTFSGLAAGTYVVTVRDANNCTTTVNVTITQPSSAVSVSISSTTNASCGGSNGALTAAGAGGVTPYQYSLNGGTYQSSGIFSGLTGGSYTVTVRDGNNCTGTVNATINNNAGPTATIGSQVNVLCFGGATGSVTVSQSGGTSPYQYQLGSGSFQTNATFGGLLAGTYTFTVRDANNCVSSVTTTITQPASAVSGSITSQTNVACNGGNGSVTVAGAGGVAPYQYSFNGGAYQSSGTFSNLAAGSYTVTVRDANLCTASVPVTITQPSNLSVSLVGSPTNVLCFGNSTGSFTVAGSGGTTPYQYSNNGGAYQSSGSFTGLAAGSYVVTVKDNNNCTSTVTVTISQPSNPLSVSITAQTNVLCFGNTTGSATVVGSGGVAPYTYNINGGAFGSSAIFNGLGAGTYTLGVSDANGCTDFVNVTITQPAGPLAATIGSQTNVLCFGQSTGAVTINATGGTLPYTYQLGSGSIVSTNTFTGLAAGAYVITVKDANNCTTVVNVTITQPASAVSGSITAQTNVACNGGSGSVTVAGAGGVAPYQYSFNGGAYQSSGTFSNLAAGSYTVTVRDANLCTATVPVTITQPSNLSVSLVGSPTNVLCFGNSTGSFTVAGSGGTSPYQYSNNGGAYQSSGSFTGLAAGSYVVTVKDNNNCTSTVTVTISQPSNPLSGSITAQTNVLCFGNSTGSVTIAGSGGTAPYQYSNNGGTYQSSGTFGSLAAGSYTVTVLDANGCTTPVAVTINQPAGPLVASSSNQVNVLCFGQSTGSVQINGIGGTAPYEFRIGSNAYGTSNAFTGLAAGTYTFTVRDANGCTATTSVTITQPGSAVDATNGPQTNVLCFGNTTGSATVVGNGGVSPYTFNINGGAYQASATFNGLGAGTYTLGVRDANGCTDIVTVTITQPAAALNASANVTNASCAGSTNGSVIITATGGTAPYQYQLGSGSFQSGNSFSGLSAGSYTVTVRDNNNCTYIVNFNVSELSSTVGGSISSQTNVLCFGASTGAVTVAGSGGVTPYQYSINGGTFQGSGSFNGLAAGNYFVTVKDANGCLGTVNVTITQPGAPVSGTITNQVNVLCNGAFTGAITITGNGGVGPYQYSLNSGAFGSSGIFTGLAAGTYVVTVRDNNQCTATVNVTITQPSTPVAGSIVAQTNVLCFGQSTGSVTVSGSGGVGPYQFNINGGSFSASNVFSNLAAGTYSVIVRDANLCTATITVTITQPNSAVSGSITNQTNASCLGAAGSVTVAGSGGTAPYQYSLNGGAFQTSGAFTGLTAGNYTVTVRDANGCTFNVPVNITQPADAVTGSITAQTNVSCFGGNNGAVTVTGSGGVAPYTYSFEGGAFSSTNSFAGLTAGSYDVTVKDNNGCLFVVSVNITQPSAPLSVSITSQTNVSCFGGSNGSVTVIGAGGTPAYVYRIGLGAYQSSGTFNNLAAGTYTITVRDSKLCTSTVTVVITQPSTPVSGTSDDVVPVACYGDASGSFVVIGAGGVAPYTYSFNGGVFNSSNSYVGLVAGTYSVVVRDANGCTSPAVVVTITQPNAPLSANIGNQTNILCYGAATGSFSINANGGTAPYQYSLNGGAYNASNTFANLTAGIYLVVVRDANGCTSSPVVVTLTQPNSPLSASITNSTNVLCYGAATGSATVVAVGGVQPYSYSWNTTPAQTGNSATGLTAGTYTVTITDFNGCSIQRTVTISQPATPISAAISNITNVSCFGGNNGSATVTASGGTGALSYSWNTTPVQHTATATGLTAGNYIVTITDGNGCTTTRPVTITQPASAVTAALVSQTNVSCFGDNNGSATITASGGTSPLTITWNTVPQQTGFTASNLTPGTYIATATDANGCNATVAVTITGPSQPLSSSIISSTNVTCFGYNNGVAVVSATGGTMPYSYSWSSTPVQTTQVASGLAPGTYIVVVTDAHGCITTSSVTITGPAAPVAVSIINSTNVACRNEASGSATASASGGTGSLSYTWNTVPAQTGPTATGLVAGTYVVTVVDAFGCSANTSVTITQPATVLTASLLNSGNPTCYGATNGFATVGAQGGNGPYSIVWNTVPQQVGPSATNLGAGNYVAAVTDANGCTRFVNVTLTQPLAAMSGSIINSQNVLCYGDSTGSATVSVSGGTTPYSYSWNSIPSQTGSTATGLPAGTYVVTVTDAQGCSIQRSVTITQPATPISVALVNQHNVTCYGFANGSATVTASGGTGALSYVWNTVPQQVGTSATNLVAGTYVVTVTDVFGCFKTLTVTITQPAAPLSAVINDRTNVLCFGQSTGAATVTVSGGTAPYSFSWNTNPAQTTQTASNLPAGNYIVTVTDANGCVTSASTTISQPATAVNASITNSTNVLCYGNATGAATVSAIGGTPGYTYLWNTVPAQTGPTATGLVAGTYNVTVTDANGCFVVRSVTITQPNAPLSASITNSVNVCPTFATGSATVTASGGTPNYLYSWNTVPAQNSATATGLAAGTYTVTITDANGCTTTATAVINNNPKPQAGGDLNICQKVATVVAAAPGQTWTPAAGNPAPATINQAGGISGMNTGGIYLFILTNQFGCSDTVAVTTTANCPLIANPDNAVTNEDTPVNINVPSNDVDPDGNINNGSVTIVDQPDNGTVTINPVTGVITYTPNPNYNGPDSFIYNICDTGMPVYCDTALVTINVVPVNDPPVANEDPGTTPEDTPITIYVPGNDTDPEDGLDSTSVTIVDPPNHGTVIVDSTGNITYTPDPNYNGPDTLIYSICDQGMPVLCDTALVIINVTPVNDPPVANQDVTSTPEDTPVTINVPVNDTDVDGNLNVGSVTITDQPSNGTVVVNPNGTIVYTPNANFNGTDTLTYQICDTGMPVYCDTALVIIFVGPVNDPPVANIDHATTPEDVPVSINVPGNDTDNDGNLDPTSVTIVDQPNNGTVTIDPVTGVITYTPNPNFNGVDTLIYQICDSGIPPLCDTALVVINVTPVNDPPVANIDHASTPEDTQVAINVPGNDTDVDGNLNNGSVVITDQPNHGTATVDPVTGVITYTPNSNFNGVDSLIYNICDTGLPVYCDTALVIINVIPVNDPPIANPDPTTTPEDTPVTIHVPDNDTDQDDGIDSTTVTIVYPPNHGTVVVDTTTGDIIYTPDPNFNGVDTLIYNICDLDVPAMCDTAIVIITVTPVNDPPIANQDNASTGEDMPVTIQVPGNDTDVDGNLDPTSVTIVDQPNNGTVTVDPVTGAITYTPNANFNGVDSLIYQICDTGMPVLCDTAYVIINVDPSNDPPIANQDNSSTNEDTPVTIQVPGNDTDVDGNLDPTTVTIVDQPNNGTVTVDPVTGEITYTPNPNFNGVDTLIYNICDTGMPVMCDTALVIINVTPVNDPPIANQDNATTPEDTPVTINVPGNDTDVDGNLDPTSVTIVDQPNNGTVTVDPVTGDVIYTPNNNFNGVDTLIYQICDTGMPVLCDTALVIINVNTVNDPPIANQDNATTPEDTPVTILVPGNDTDLDGNLDPTSVVIVDQPNNGTVTIDPVTGEVVYTPNPNFNGVDTLIYQICDTGMPVLCDTALVIINVTPVNDPPVANQDNVITPEDTPVTINVPGNDTDVDGNLDPTSVTIVDQPNNGTVTVDPVTGDIIYTPNPNFNGVDTLIYNICDTGMPVLCDTALVIINVTPVNDPPIANTDYGYTGEDMPVTIDLPANDTDVDGNLDTTSVTIVTPPVNGTVVINPDGSIIYTPNPNFWGADSLIYQICDTGMPVLCDTAWVYINVETNNDELIAILDTASTPEDTPVTIQVPDNDIDVDNNIDYSSVTIILPPANGTVSGIDPVTGFITYTPNLNFNGTDSLIYQICDLGSPVYCDTAWVYINVGPVNDPPVAVTDTASTLEDTPININIDFNDYDVDGNLDTNSVVIVTPPLFGNAIYDPTLGEIIYTPNANFFGTDSLLYNICDSLGLCDTAWVFITIQSVPDLVLDPSIFPSGNNISCFGANDGSIDLTIDLGVPPYTITWTGPNGFSANTEDISGLAPGTYTVVVVDANGSTATGSITLTEPPLLQSSTVVVSYSGGYNVSCGGAVPACDGAIDLSVSGGSPAYSYSWIGPNGFVAVTQDISNLCVGTYTVVVTDANGCTTTQTVTLTAPPALEVGGVAFEYNGGNNISCANACDGSIDLTITGGVAPFVITWTGPNGFASSSQDITGLCAGVYTVTVVDANNCSTTATITLLAPQPLTSGAVAAVVAGGYNITCNGACNGSINATIGGGTAPYSYSWVGPNGFVAVTEDLSGLCAGTYTLTVTDANGCTSTSTVTLTQPEVLSATAIAAITDGGTNISCNGTCDGSIDMTITGGTAPYTVSWTGPNGFVSSLVDINALCVGTYVATVTDANGCTASVTMVLTGPTPLVSTGVASSYTGGFNISCNGGNNGSIDVTTTGGSGSYTFNWSGPGGFSANTEDIANLYAGTYTLIVSDVNGCSDTLTFNMTEPEPISLVAVNAPSFCGLSNGTIDLTVNGGSGFYNYVWTDGNTGLVIGNSEDLFNITGGVYIVAVTDTNGCTMIDTVIVGDKPPVVITGTTTPTNCNGACNGAINVTLVGDGPYIINWTGPNNFSSTDEDLVALCAGTYIITVQDGNSCTVVDTFVITAPNAINITVVANNAATCSASNGSIDISVEGGSGTYSYSWTGPNGFTSTSQDLTGLAEGCYVVTVTDASGCTSTQTICVGSVSALVLNTIPVNVSCNGLNNGSACAEVTGSTPPVSFLWSNGDTTQCTDSLAPGTYVVIVTDANGCTGSDTIVITEPDAIIVAADIPVYPNGYNVSGPDAEDGSIDLTVTGGTVPYTYDWNLPAPNDILEDQVSLPADTYVVVITDANGCTITEEYILTEPPLIELPTGFSPDNGDGLNDFYVIHGIDGLIDNKFTVFNRWGQVIFEKEGYQNDWAGTNFQGRLMPDGTYFILFTVNVPNQGNLTFKATVELRHNLGK